MSKQTQGQTPKKSFRISPAVSILILIVVVLVAWTVVKRASRAPVPDFTPVQYAPVSE